MPLASKLFAGSVFPQFGAQSFTGKVDTDLATAISSAIVTHLKTPNIVSCTLNGVVGPIGSITSIGPVIGVIPVTMAGFMNSKAASKRIIGKNALQLFSAVSNGLTPMLTSLILTGKAAGIATGGGIGSFSMLNEKALSGLIFAQFLKKQIKGKNAKDLAECISFGVVKQLKIAKIPVICTGAVAPVPPVGPSPAVNIKSILTTLK